MDDAPRPTLDIYAVACLAGGVDRVVDTALVALVRSGRVRVTRPGELEVAALDRRHPVEGAVLDALGANGPRSAQTVCRRAAADPRLADVTARLLEAGLLARRWSAVVRGSRPVPTRAGRLALDEAGRAHPEDDDAWRVSLRGREALGASRARIFDQPVVDRRVRGPRLTARMDQVAHDRRQMGSGGSPGA